TTVRVAASSRTARRPSLSSTACCSYQSAGRRKTSPGGRLPCSSSFESGGRSYGRTGSAPTRTIRPSNPPWRTAPTARPPAPPPRRRRSGPLPRPSPISARARLDGDEDVAVPDPHLVGRDRPGRRRLVDGAGADVEAAVVEGAPEGVLLELAAGERGVLVAAD